MECKCVDIPDRDRSMGKSIASSVTPYTDGSPVDDTARGLEIWLTEYASHAYHVLVSILYKYESIIGYMIMYFA